MEEHVKKENHTLRSVTAIMLFLIGYAHFFICVDYGSQYSYELWSFVEVLIGFGRFAIPIFFMISGYFLFSKDGHTEAKVGKKILHIIYLIILLKVVYFIIVGVAYMQGKVGLEQFVASFLVLDLNSTAHIWFLYVLLLMYVFFWILQRYKVDVRKFYWIGWIPVVIELFTGVVLAMFIPVDQGNEIRHLVADSCYPFLGYTFFMLGYYLHQNKEKFDVMFSTPVLIIFFVFGSIMSAMEAHFIPQRVLYFGTLLQAVGLFLVTFRFAEDQLRCRPLEYIGKNLMPFFYVFMMIPTFISVTYLQGNISPFDFYIICPIVGVIATTFMALAAHLILTYALKKRGERKATAS